MAEQATLPAPEGATETTTAAVVQLTPRAAETAKGILEREGITSGGLRLGVDHGGCSGFQYRVNLERDHRPDDIVVEIDGLRVFVDPASAEYLRGMTVDYVDALHGAGFKFSNPNATRTCGCGTSFSA